MFKQKIYFGLAETCYLITLLTALGFYTLGLWLLLPNNIEKYSILGGGFATTLILFISIYFSNKRISEKPDERFYHSLLVAALGTLLSLLVFLFIVSLICIKQSITLYSGVIFLIIAACILIFDIIFFIVDKRGGHVSN